MSKKSVGAEIRSLLRGGEAEDGTLERVKAAATLSEVEQRADDLGAELARRNVHGVVGK